MKVLVLKVLSSASGEWKFTTLHLSDSLWLLAAEGCSAQPHLYPILPPRFKRSESLCTCISDVSNWRQSDLHALFSNKKLEASRSNRANSTLPDSICRANNIHLVMGRYKHLLHSGSSCMKPPKRQWKQSIGWVRCWEFLHTECSKGVFKWKCRTVFTVSLFLWSFVRFLLSLACLPPRITPCSAWFLHWGYIIDETATCDCATLSNTQSISWLGGSTLFVSMDDFDSLTLAICPGPLNWVLTEAAFGRNFAAKTTAVPLLVRSQVPRTFFWLQQATLRDNLRADCKTIFCSEQVALWLVRH